MIKVWDIRMVAELGTIDIGQHPINKLSLDRGAKKLLAASDDGTIKVVDVLHFNKTSELVGHDTAVQCVSISPNDNFVVSGASDATFRIWSK